jgi:hypothetical protein
VLIECGVCDKDKNKNKFCVEIMISISGVLLNLIVELNDVLEDFNLLKCDTMLIGK